MSMKKLKKRTKVSIFYLAILLIISGCQQSTTISNDSKSSIYTDNYQQQLDTIVPKLIEKYKCLAVGVGIIENGQISFTKVYGEHQKGYPAKVNTIFNVASITKPVVAATVLKLVANGDWDLDEPLYHYYTDPDVENDSRAKLITTRHCLSHTAGFKNWRWNEEDGKLKFNFEPGARFQYSGEGMEYLRKALEQKFSIGLDKLVDSLVFKPLSIEDATLGWLEGKDTLRFAKWYDTKGNLHEMDYKTSNVNAADDMLITVKDMLRFGNGIMNQTLIKDDLYQEMITPQVPINKNVGQGLGWVVYDKLENGEYIINHDGGDPGVVATLILLPKSKNGIAIFVNSDNGASITNSIVDRIFQNGRKIIEGLHWENQIPPTAKIEQGLLKKYAGTYQTDRNFSITFREEEQRLLTESEVFPLVTLYPKSDTEFFPLPFEVYFKFKEENEGLIVELLSADGIVELKGSKLAD